MKAIFRVLALSVRRTPKLIVYTICSLVLVCLLFAMFLSVQSPVLQFSWLKKCDSISYRPQIPLSDMTRFFGDENLLGEISDGWFCKNTGGSNMGMASEIDFGAAKILKVPLSKGTWFSDDGEAQVMVSSSLAGDYRIGERYAFELSQGTITEDGGRDTIVRQITARVAGYLSEQNYSIGNDGSGGAAEQALMDLFPRHNAMLFCSRQVVRTAHITVDGRPLITVNALLNITEEAVRRLTEAGKNLNIWCSPLSNNYQGYLQLNQSWISLYSYCMLAVFFVGLITVISNFVAHRETQRRFRTVVLLCGTSPKMLLLGEMLKDIAVALCALAISVIFFMISNGNIYVNGVSLMTPFSFLLGLVIVTVMCVVMAAGDILSILRLNPLKVLRQDP